MGELRNTIEGAMGGPFGIPASGGPLPVEGSPQPSGAPGGGIQESAMALMQGLADMGADQQTAMQIMQGLTTGQMTPETLPEQLQQHATAFVQATQAMGGGAPEMGGGTPVM